MGSSSANWGSRAMVFGQRLTGGAVATYLLRFAAQTVSSPAKAARTTMAASPHGKGQVSTNNQH